MILHDYHVRQAQQVCIAARTFKLSMDNAQNFDAAYATAKKKQGFLMGQRFLISPKAWGEDWSAGDGPDVPWLLGARSWDIEVRDKLISLGVIDAKT